MKADTFEELVKSIGSATKILQQQMRDVLPSIRFEISDIIAHSDGNIERVERLLDILLDYNQLGVGTREFKRLNGYYAKVNPKNARFYETEYRKQNSE